MKYSSKDFGLATVPNEALKYRLHSNRKLVIYFS